MRAPVSNWTTLNVDPLKPILYVTAGTNGKFTNITKDYFGLVAGVRDLAGNEKKFLSDFVLRLPEIDLLKGGIQSFGTVTYSLLDKIVLAGIPYVTNDITNDSYFQNGVKSKWGFDDLELGDYFDLPDHTIIGNPTFRNDIWTFVAEDAKRLLGKKKIFRKPPFDELDSTLTKAAPTGGVEIDVVDATVFIDPSNLPDQFLLDSEITSSNKLAYVAIGSEVLSYEVVDTAASPDELEMNATVTGVDRGRFFTERSEHNDGEFVTQFYCFNNMTPCDALLYILLTDGGHVYYDLSTFDSAFENMGFGLTSGSVEISNIERLGWKYFPLRQMNCMSLGSHEPQDGLKWITDNILKPAGLYIFINSSGRLDVGTINRFELIEEFSSVKTFVKDDIVSINSLDVEYDKMINGITLQYNVNPMTGQHTQESTVTYPDSITSYKAQEDNHVIKTSLLNVCDPRLPGVCSGDNPLDREGAMIQWFLFANPPGVIDFDVMPTQWLAEPPDNVELTHDLFPDLQNGDQGVSALSMILLQQTIAPFKNRYNYKAFIPDIEDKLVIGTSFTSNVIVSGSLDDTSLAFSATNDETTEAADAFVDLDLGGQAAFIITVTVTEPSGTANTFGYFRLGFHIIDDPTGTPADTLAWDTGAIRYATDGNTSYDLKFYFHHGAVIGSGLGERFKIDYFARNKTGGDEATIVFKEFSFDVGETITES